MDQSHVIFKCDCPFCGRTTYLNVKKESYNAWQTGTLIQNAFPDWTPQNREILKTGICPKCWDETFKDVE